MLRSLVGSEMCIRDRLENLLRKADHRQNQLNHQALALTTLYNQAYHELRHCKASDHETRLSPNPTSLHELASQPNPTSLDELASQPWNHESNDDERRQVESLQVRIAAKLSPETKARLIATLASKTHGSQQLLADSDQLRLNGHVEPAAPGNQAWSHDSAVKASPEFEPTHFPRSDEFKDKSLQIQKRLEEKRAKLSSLNAQSEAPPSSLNQNSQQGDQQLLYIDF
eukprot:TRINITY_DN15595_c0_g1_i2.p1 TRINITY_DN15595_c0_g1~~TRINITY_DN15595_c0_g1_i2.p1  ORF type:complete len:227 (-),score=37.95 TRINITY_DN15595_c0_g1_i2:63-743(-)